MMQDYSTVKPLTQQERDEIEDDLRKLRESLGPEPRRQPRTVLKFRPSNKTHEEQQQELRQKGFLK